MRKLPLNGIKLPSNGNALSTFVGLDIAANRDKGLRCNIRVDPSTIFEVTLKLRQPIHLQSEFPYVDIPFPDEGLSADYLVQTFFLSDQQAQTLALAFQHATVIAIDGPPKLAGTTRRTSEILWHNHVIPGVKNSAGGIYWTPMQSAVDQWLKLISNAARELTTEQITKLGQSLWMFVGFWTHELFRRAGRETIEVFPSALRTVCNGLIADGYLAEFEQHYRDWGGSDCFTTFAKTKSETSDAAIACFTAYLHSIGKTEELHPGEIIIPLHPTKPFTQSPSE